MTKDLTNADLENFQSAYEKTPCADVIARAVQENGVTAASKNFAAKANHDHVFSVEVETGKITNQKKSGRCWLFSAFFVSIVLQFVRFHSGNVKKALLRPRFSSASTLLFSQHLDFTPLSPYN